MSLYLAALFYFVSSLLASFVVIDLLCKINRYETLILVGLIVVNYLTKVIIKVNIEKEIPK